MMHELVVEVSGWFAAMVVGLGVVVASIVVAVLSAKSSVLRHEEAMARIDDEHQREVLRINRDMPKLVDGVGAKREQRVGDRLLPNGRTHGSTE